MTWWGVLGGAVLGAVVLALHQVLPPLFTPDPAVQQALAAALVVVALSQPLSGLVFVLDGVLIGAGDGRWLAGAQAGGARWPTCPLVLWVRASQTALLAASDTAATQAHAVTVLWWAVVAFMRCAAWRWGGAPGATPGW